MFDPLDQYELNDHFFFNRADDLRQVCNAPTDKSGIYIIYALKGGRIELVYIGCSGRTDDNGKMVIRRAGLGGIKDRIVNGKQFGDRRRITWARKMVEEEIEALDVYWYVTHTDKYIECPCDVERRLLEQHVEMHGRRPRWNRRS